MTTEQKDSIEQLKQLIIFIDESLKNLVIQGRYLKRKKRYLLSSFVNVCDLADCISSLLASERTNAAQILLRSVQESYINACFIFLDKSQLWIDSCIAELWIDNKRLVKGIEDVREEYPDADTGQHIISLQKLNLLKRKSDRALRKLNAKYGPVQPYSRADGRRIDVKPYSLRDKTIVIDYILSSRSSKNLRQSYESNYLIVYSHLSGATHGSVLQQGLRYKQVNSEGIQLSRHGDMNDIEPTATVTFAYLLGMADLFSRQFGTPSLVALKPYKRLAALLQNQDKNRV